MAIYRSGTQLLSRISSISTDAALVGNITAVGSFTSVTVSGSDLQHADIDTNTAVGDLVNLTSGTGATAGFYRITAVGVNAVTLDRAPGGAGVNIACTVFKDCVAIFATDATNGQRIMNYSHQNKPLQIGGDVLSTSTGYTSEDVTLAGALWVDKSTNRVRIGDGTAVPGEKLEVAGNLSLNSGGATDYLKLGIINYLSFGGGGGGYVDFYKPLRDNIGSGITAGGDANLTFSVQGTGNFVFTTDSDTNLDIGSGQLFVKGSSGNVGVNTTTPVGKQHTVLSSTAPALFGGNTIGSYTSVTFPTANKDYANKTAIGTGASHVGDMLIVTGGTGATTGVYRIITLVSADSVQVDRNIHAAGADITDGAVSTVRDVVSIGVSDGTNGQMIGNWSAQNKPLQIGGHVLSTSTGYTSEDVNLGGALWVDSSTGDVIIGDGSMSPTSTRSGLDISSGGLSLVLGAVNDTNDRTNSTEKVVRIVGFHYTNAEEPVAMVMAVSNASANILDFGGASGITNAATQIGFHTATNNTTTSGTERVRIDSSGNFGINTVSPGAKLEVAQTITATGALKGIIYTGAVNTNQTLSTEIPSVTITTAGREWATGALATQREVLITQPTYSFVGGSTITDAATVGIAGAPIKSTNATITNTHGLLIQAGAVSTATNSYGLTVNAQTGATNNYAAAFLGGNVGIGTAAPKNLLHVGSGLVFSEKTANTEYAIAQNIYRSTSSWKAVTTGASAMLSFEAGDFSFYGADSVAADADVTLRTLITVKNSGNVGINTTVFGTSLANGFALGNGTAATGALANGWQAWSADFLGTGGDARMHIMGEGSATALTVLGSGKITAQGTTGGYTKQLAEATATLSGASTTIQVNIPSGSRILGVQLRVDTLITSGDGGTTWTAVFVNVPTTAITSGQAFTKNTKFAKITADEISTGEVDITVTPNSGTFSAGVIRAIVYYELYDTMADAA